MSAQIKVIQDIYQKFSQGDFPGILKYLDEEIVWDADAPSYGVPLLMPGKGIKHVESFFQNTELVEFQKFDIKNFLEGGSQVAAVVDVDLVVKATGKKVFIPCEVHLWTFGKGGRPVRFLHCMDRSPLVEGFKKT